MILSLSSPSLLDLFSLSFLVRLSLQRLIFLICSFNSFAVNFFFILISFLAFTMTIQASIAMIQSFFLFALPVFNSLSIILFFISHLTLACAFLYFHLVCFSNSAHTLSQNFNTSSTSYDADSLRQQFISNKSFFSVNHLLYAALLDSKEEDSTSEG